MYGPFYAHPAGIYEPGYDGQSEWTIPEPPMRRAPAPAPADGAGLGTLGLAALIGVPLVIGSLVGYHLFTASRTTEGPITGNPFSDAGPAAGYSRRPPPAWRPGSPLRW